MFAGSFDTLYRISNIIVCYEAHFPDAVSCSSIQLALRTADDFLLVDGCSRQGAADGMALWSHPQTGSQDTS